MTIRFAFFIKLIVSDQVFNLYYDNPLPLLIPRSSLSCYTKHFHFLQFFVRHWLLEVELGLDLAEE